VCTWLVVDAVEDFRRDRFAAGFLVDRPGFFFIVHSVI